MARSRIVKPEFFTDEDLVDLEPLIRLFYIGLWQHADREGRLEDRPRRLQLAILPADECDPEWMLGELAKIRAVVRYEVDGKRYLWIPGFSRHQSIHIKEAPSQIPSCPDEHGASPVQEPDEHGASRPASTSTSDPTSSSASASDVTSTSASTSKDGDGVGELLEEQIGRELAPSEQTWLQRTLSEHDCEAVMEAVGELHPGVKYPTRFVDKLLTTAGGKPDDRGYIGNAWNGTGSVR